MNFKDLQQEWREKLKASGFRDEESAGFLRSGWRRDKEYRAAVSQGDGERRAAMGAAVMGERQEYYRRAGIFLHNYPFRSDVMKRVWRMHTEGRFPSGIAKAVFKSRAYVKSTIRDCKRRMMAYDFNALSEWSGDACEQLEEYNGR